MTRLLLLCLLFFTVRFFSLFALLFTLPPDPNNKSVLACMLLRPGRKETVGRIAHLLSVNRAPVRLLGLVLVLLRMYVA